MACDRDPDRCDGPGAPEGEATLLEQGWKRCFVAEGARLEEAVETYEELGFEVTTLQIDARAAECTACASSVQAHWVIYTRKPVSGDG